jgi:hypothetical protein
MKTSKHSQERGKNSFYSGRKLPVKLSLLVKRNLLMKLLLLLLLSGFVMPQALAGVGNITDYYLDNFYFEEGAFGQPDFIQVAPNIYATVFRGNMTKGILETYLITGQ